MCQNAIAVQSDNPKASREILDFINGFVGPNAQRKKILSEVFTQGYCYYFALILKDAFGEMIAYIQRDGLHHIVWLDTRENGSGLAYDIDGVVEEYEFLVPAIDLLSDLESFRHRGHDHDVYFEMEKYCVDHYITSQELYEQVYKIIPAGDAFYPFPNEQDAIRYWNEFKLL